MPLKQPVYCLVFANRELALESRLRGALQLSHTEYIMPSFDPKYGNYPPAIYFRLFGPALYSIRKRPTVGQKKNIYSNFGRHGFEIKKKTKINK